MTRQEQSDVEFVAALEIVGPVLSVDLIEVCLARKESLTPLFLQLFADSRQDAWPLANDARWFRGGHAGKFLLAYQEPAALPIFEQIYASFEKLDEELVAWFGTDLAYFGKTAVPFLIRVLQTDSYADYHYGRAIAATTLKIIALQHPETRAQVVGALRGQLPAQLSANLVVDEMWTNIVLELSDLKDEESRALIEEMYEAIMIDDEMLPLSEYEAAFTADAPPEATETFDIFVFYEELRQRESHQQKMSGRRNLLRKQGYIPPEPDPLPYANRFSRWFNERLLKD